MTLRVDAGASALGHALQLNSTLKYLNLADNAIGSEGGVALANGLGGNRCVLRINLNDNQVGDAGAIAFAQTLGSAKSPLEAVALRRNAIEVQGCVALADAVTGNQALVTLDLSGNPAMGRPAALAFGEAMRGNQVLTELHLELEPGNFDGGNAIAAAMRTNTTIVDLTCCGGGQGGEWPMEPSIRAEVDNTLRINKFLRNVDQDGNATVFGQAREGGQARARMAVPMPVSTSMLAPAPQPSSAVLSAPGDTLQSQVCVLSFMVHVAMVVSIWLTRVTLAWYSGRTTPARIRFLRAMARRSTENTILASRELVPWKLRRTTC
jgi:hypothetical protein